MRFIPSAVLPLLLVAAFIPATGRVAAQIRAQAVADSTEDVDPRHAAQALRKLHDYLAARSQRLPAGWIFGPNLDDAYFYRIRFYHTNEIFEDERASPQRAEALAAGVPALEDIPGAERRALMLVAYDARRSAIDTLTRFLVVKHFPGGSRMLESTEGVAFQVVFHDDSATSARRLEPFRAVIGCRTPPAGIMTSHAAYPRLETMCAMRHPELAPLVAGDTLVPCTFSPRLLRGLLRRDLGFSGVIVSDWVDMGAINRYLIDRRAALKRAFPTLSTHATVFFLCVHAGVNLITGMRNRLIRDRRRMSMAELTAEIASFARAHPDWEARVRAAAGRLFAKAAGDHPEAARPDPAAVPLEDCVRAIIGEPLKDPELRWMNATTLDSFQDLWNRQGIMHLMLRAWYLEARFGIAVPTLPFGPDNERVMGREVEKAWLGSLAAMPTFQSDYRKIRWNSEASADAWRGGEER